MRAGHPVHNEELDTMLRADYDAWVQSVKDAGAWQGE